MKLASKCEQQLRDTLTAEQNERLEELLNKRFNYLDLELRATFQAAFSMAMELSKL